MGIYPYFDRVASKANPVDGLSRGRKEGPWRQIIKAKLPENLEELLREARRGEPSEEAMVIDE